ncbi:MAG: 8-amino-7-oxononanoate synthase [Betaproteobacteria bacterium]|nr:8-amino-7-oxononanoate synthase [Betaproteobacteria bacterium]
MSNILSLRHALEQLSEDGLLRQRRILDSACGPRAIVDGREWLSFCSNDYLGLAAHPALAAAIAEGAARWGAGSGASHLICGHLRPHEDAEIALAHFSGFERALLFSTGYLANLAVIPALVGRGDAVFADRLNHASLIDAARLSGAEHRRYAHSDMGALAALLAASTAKRKLISSDAVFSMDGDLAPLPELLELAERFDAWLLVDDAHGFGVLGREGRGSWAHFDLPAAERVIYMGTLGKAAGVGGAFVAASATVAEYLLQRGRSYVFSTAISPALAVAVSKSLELIAAMEREREHLRALAQRLQAGWNDSRQAAAGRWRLIESPTAIQPLVVGGNEETVALMRDLSEQGIWAPAIRPPTVPKGAARLRISLSAAHSCEDVDTLLAALDHAARKGGS